MGAVGFYRDVDIPDDCGKATSAAATGWATLPSHVAWSGQGALDLDDPTDRNYAYEILLAEGTADDIRAYVDPVLLAEAWDDLCLGPHVRDQWDAWMREHGLIA